jgi:pentatricopeptide repeat protein
VFLAFIYPFSWAHVYIPVLPASLAMVLQAPLPYIIGVESDILSRVHEMGFSIPDTTVQVHLDANFVSYSHALPTPRLPSHEHKKLLSQLERCAPAFALRSPTWATDELPQMDMAVTQAARPTDVIDHHALEASRLVAQQGESSTGTEWRLLPNGQCNWLMVRTAFFRLHVSLLRDFNDFVILAATRTKESPRTGSGSGGGGATNNNNNEFYSQPRFDEQGFLSKRRPRDRAFFSDLLSTQHFHTFIDERVHPDGQRDADVLFFSQSIQAKTSRSLFGRLTFLPANKARDTTFLDDVDKYKYSRTVVTRTADALSWDPLTSAAQLGVIVPDSYETFPPLQHPICASVEPPARTLLPQDLGLAAQDVTFGVARNKLGNRDKDALEIDRVSAIVQPQEAVLASWFVLYCAAVGIPGSPLLMLQQGGDADGGGWQFSAPPTPSVQPITAAAAAAATSTIPVINITTQSVAGSPRRSDWPGSPVSTSATSLPPPLNTHFATPLSPRSPPALVPIVTRINPSDNVIGNGIGNGNGDTSGATTLFANEGNRDGSSNGSAAVKSGRTASSNRRASLTLTFTNSWMRHGSSGGEQSKNNPRSPTGSAVDGDVPDAHADARQEVYQHPATTRHDDGTTTHTLGSPQHYEHIRSASTTPRDTRTGDDGGPVAGSDAAAAAADAATGQSRPLSLSMPHSRGSVSSFHSIVMEARVQMSREEWKREQAIAVLHVAFDVLEASRESGVNIDQVVYRALIDACGRCGDLDHAIRLLGMMHEAGVKADARTYSNLIQAFSLNATNTFKMGMLSWEHLKQEVEAANKRIAIKARMESKRSGSAGRRAKQRRGSEMSKPRIQERLLRWGKTSKRSGLIAENGRRPSGGKQHQQQRQGMDDMYAGDVDQRPSATERGTARAKAAFQRLMVKDEGHTGGIAMSTPNTTSFGGKTQQQQQQQQHSRSSTGMSTDTIISVDPTTTQTNASRIKSAVGVDGKQQHPQQQQQVVVLEEDVDEEEEEEDESVFKDTPLDAMFVNLRRDADGEVCPQASCATVLTDGDVRRGWRPDPNDYTTCCPKCKRRFVAVFTLMSDSPTWEGSTGVGTPLFCQVRSSVRFVGPILSGLLTCLSVCVRVSLSDCLSICLSGCPCVCQSVLFI